MKLKYVDNYTWAMILLIIGIILFYGGFNKESKPIIITGSFIALTAIIISMKSALYGTGEIVKNDYHGEVAIKRESGSNEPEIIPVGSLISGIDGAATDFNHNEVYKIRNGIKVKIMQSGEIRETTLLARLMNTGYTSR